MSRRRSRSEGFIGCRCAARIAAFVCKLSEEVRVGPGRGGKSDCGSRGTVCRPM
jgi:hypothetical protein